jgi:TPR repeat protein
MQTLIRERPTMTLLPRFAFSRQQAQAAQLERQMSALRAELDHCAGLARRWKKTRYGIIAGVAAAALMAGVVLGAYGEPLLQPAKGLAQSVDSGAAPDNADAAYAAYQNNDYPSALRLVQPAAEAGDARAQSLLALMYYRGRGLPEDDRAAAEWFRRAAEAGDTSAQFYLGGMYSVGRGVPQVYREAARFYRMAAERGDAQAQYNLGLAYARGEGVEQDLVKAHLYFNLAAARLNDPRGRAAKNRDHVAAQISSEQLERAQKLAREWRPLTAPASQRADAPHT